jgi:hypothetical protein
MFDSQFEALFHGSWPKLSTHELAKCFKTPHFSFLLPKPSFGMGNSDSEIPSVIGSESHGDDSMTMCMTVLLSVEIKR